MPKAAKWPILGQFQAMRHAHCCNHGAGLPQHQNLVSWAPTNKIWGVGLACYMMLVPQGTKCCQMAIFVFGANGPQLPHAHHRNHAASPVQCLENFSRGATSNIVAILRPVPIPHGIHSPKTIKTQSKMGKMHQKCTFATTEWPWGLVAPQRKLGHHNQRPGAPHTWVWCPTCHNHASGGAAEPGPRARPRAAQ